LALLDIDISQDEVVHLVDGGEMFGIHAYSMRKADVCVKSIKRRVRGADTYKRGQQ